MTDSGWAQPATGAPASASARAAAEHTHEQPRALSRRRVIATLGGAIGAGVATQAITWEAPLGLSWLVLVTLLVGVAFAVHGRRRPTSLALTWAGATLWLAGAYVAHASLWASSTALPASAILLAALPALLARRWSWSDLGRLPLLAWALVRELPGATREGAGLPARAVDAGARSSARHALYGLLLGGPLTLVFVVLLSADPRFTHALGDVFDGSVSWLDFASWSVATAVLYLILHLAYVRLRPARAADRTGTDDVGPYRTPAHAEAEPGMGESWRLRPVTWMVVLAQLVAVFGLFVAVSFPDLFAGHETAQAPGTYTYAEHLHAGFAQVSVATLLVVLTIVIGHWGLRGWRRAGTDARVPGGRPIRMLEVALVLLAMITLASCWQRLHIYQEAYGYTYLRLGVALCQVAVLGLLALTAVKSIARRWRTFPAAVIALGLGLILVTGSLDTDEMLARWNLQRAEQRLVEGASKGYDAAYLMGLGDDALPALTESALDDAPQVEQRLREQWLAERAQRHAHGWRALRGLPAAW